VLGAGALVTFEPGERDRLEPLARGIVVLEEAEAETLERG
jgi:hypothetical protein